MLVTAKVVNVKTKYIRPEYENLQEWCENPNNVYIGRKGIVFIDGERYPKKDSFFANPYKLGKHADTIEEILEMYENKLRQDLEDDPETMRKKLWSIRNKNLGCWCKIPKVSNNEGKVSNDDDNPCHGDVLIKIMNELVESPKVVQSPSFKSIKLDMKNKKEKYEKYVRRCELVKTKAIDTLNDMRSSRLANNPPDKKLIRDQFTKWRNQVRKTKYYLVPFDAMMSTSDLYDLWKKEYYKFKKSIKEILRECEKDDSEE